MRREVKPEPVPPPKEWKIRNPCRFDELKRGKFGVYVKNYQKNTRRLAKKNTK